MLDKRQRAYTPRLLSFINLVYFFLFAFSLSVRFLLWLTRFVHFVSTVLLPLHAWIFVTIVYDSPVFSFSSNTTSFIPRSLTLDYRKMMLGMTLY